VILHRRSIAETRERELPPFSPDGQALALIPQLYSCIASHLLFFLIFTKNNGWIGLSHTSTAQQQQQQ
jgi:hypothetical protein